MGPIVTILIHFLNFVLLWNTGMAFGIFESDSYTYHAFSFLIFLVIIFLIVWLFKSIRKIEKISIALIIGGALGNWFDRLYIMQYQIL